MNDGQMPDPESIKEYVPANVDDDDDFIESGEPLPEEGREDPLTRDERSPLQTGNDPGTGFPADKQVLGRP